MQVWNVLLAARWKIQDLKRTKKLAICTPSHKFVGLYVATKACIDNLKKLLNSNIFSTCPHNMVNIGPLMAETVWRVWGTPANFNRVRVLASLLQRRCSTEVHQTLHDVWPSAGLVYYIHFRGLLPPNGILPGAKFTLRPSLAFACFGSVTAQHSSSGHS